ncbi:MAG: TetR/AcrR family transcriptional regulator [Sphingobium sp.]
MPTGKKKHPPSQDQNEVEAPLVEVIASDRIRSLYKQGASDPRQIRSAKALREGLLRLLERKSFDQITVREIAAEAGVHNATFFRHHADKESLLDAVAADEINRLVVFSLPSGHRLEGNKALCEYVSSRRTLWKALLNGGARGAMREEYLRISAEVAARHTGSQSWLPPDLATIASTMLIFETTSWWLNQEEGAYSNDEVATILDQLVGAIVAKKAPARRR